MKRSLKTYESIVDELSYIIEEIDQFTIDNEKNMNKFQIATMLSVPVHLQAQADRILDCIEEEERRTV